MKKYDSIYNINVIEIKNMSVGFIINQLKFINKTNINIEYKDVLNKELKRKTLKLIK